MTYENILELIDARGLCRLGIKFEENEFKVRAFSTRTCLTYVFTYNYAGQQIACELA